MSNLKELADFPLLAIWGETVRARRVQGERITLAVVELAPNAVVPEHVHENEQLGICLQGSGTFTLDGEVRDIKPGTTWRILANRPHSLVDRPRRRRGHRRLHAGPSRLGRSSDGRRRDATLACRVTLA